GYNKTKLKDRATLLVEYNGDPIVAAWEFGKGRTLAFTPDCAPHWGSPEFLEWEYYSIFWKQAVEWLAGVI
ncbi:MAG: cytoplasmic protein, partial [Thaumarchaeota archaeon]